jgi:Ca2+-binding RTX toxin-like protein
MSNYSVSSTSELMSALKSAHGGDTISLGAGTYSGLSLQNLSFDSAVTIKSADLGNQAVLTNFNIAGSKGLSFSNLDFKAVTTSTVEDYAFRVSNSTNISFDKLSVHGSMDNNAANDMNGFLIRDSANVSVTNSDLQQLFTGINHLDDNGLKISGNTVHEIRMDGVRGAGSSNVEVSNNHFYNFHAQAGDHDDAIQFWSVGSKAASTNIVISGNDFTRGTGDVVQGIFIEGDGAKGISGVKILNNTITGGMYNGIAMFGGSNVEVSGNTVVGYKDMQSWIRMDSIDNISLNHNTSNIFILNALTHLTETGDVLNSLVAVTTTLPSYAVTTPVVTTVTPPISSIVPPITETVVAPPVVTAPVVTAPVITTPVVTPVVTAPIGGTSGNDNQVGTDGGDSLSGLGGNDTLSGGGGDDSLSGGVGTNVLDGGSGVDTVTYDGIVYGVNVDLSIKTAQVITSGVKDTITNIENVTGSANSDGLRGDAGANVLKGEGGNDYLTGRGGADQLYGGAGADRFVYAATSDSTFATAGRDTIRDFNHAEGDLIDLHSLRPSSQPFSKVADFTGHTYEMKIVADGDHYVLQADMNGDKTADFAINIYTVGGAKLVESDVWV